MNNNHAHEPKQPTQGDTGHLQWAQGKTHALNQMSVAQQ